MKTEHAIVISPSLAQALGLEEAVLYQLLSDICAFSPDSEWLHIDGNKINELLPFWDAMSLQRVAQSLVNKDLLKLRSAPYTQSHCLTFSLQALQQGNSATKQASPVTGNGRGANRIAPHWQPSADTVQHLLQQSIPRAFIYQHLAEFVTFWRDKGDVAASWDAKYLKHIIRLWQQHQAETPFVDQAARQPQSMTQLWRPSADAMDILQRTGINTAFIEDAIPEFILYWQEKGSTLNTWNSKFLQHVKRQWAIYKRRLKHDGEPRPIQANWQPDADVFDILAMANIDKEFAHSLVKEFVIYWRDSQQLNTSWNTKFLQHVKYRWAQQHQLIASNSHAGQPRTHQSNHPAGDGFINKHTDRSWAEGL